MFVSCFCEGVRSRSYIKNAGISTKAIAVDCPAMQGMSGGPVLGMTGVMGMISCGNSDRTIVVCNETIASVLDAYVHPEVRTICVLFVSTYSNHCLLTTVLFVICFL